MFAIEVFHPFNGWTRLGGRYETKAIARTWYRFISGAWHGLPLRTVKVDVVRKSNLHGGSDGRGSAA